jgi:hypothetical protein
MDPEQRRNLIIDFVSVNHGCLAEDVVEGLKSFMSRTLVFKDLREAVKDGIIEDNRLNRRDHRYSVNKNNPLLLLMHELNEVEKAFVDFLQNARDMYDKQVSSAKQTDDRYARYRADSLAICATSSSASLFVHIINTYSAYALFKWPALIKNKELLDKLYTTLFAKIYHIISRLSEHIAFGNVRFEGKYDDKKHVFMYDIDFTLFRGIREYLRNYGLETKEYGALMEIIWKISSDILPADIRTMAWKEGLETG